jgi:hypothetical protein
MLCSNRFNQFAAPAEHADRGALRREQADAGFADTGAAAGDNGNFSGQRFC